MIVMICIASRSARPPAAGLSIVAAGDLPIKISELFYSIQGESTRAGLPCVFIRLSGCNLRCCYCDSQYTFPDGESRSISAIMAYAAHYPDAIVEVTGGEPLCQPNTISLLRKLKEAGRTVLLETNGSLDLAPVPDGVIKIMDLKCPDSGMSNKMCFANLQYLSPADELKFVLTSRRDYEWAVDIIRRRLPESLGPGPLPALLLSAVPNKLEAAVLTAWILEDQLPVRLQLQIHKIIWPESKRGV